MFPSPFLWILLIPLVFGDIVNRTIDDQFGDEVTGQQVRFVCSRLYAQMLTFSKGYVYTGSFVDPGEQLYWVCCSSKC